AGRPAHQPHAGWRAAAHVTAGRDDSAADGGRRRVAALTTPAGRSEDGRRAYRPARIHSSAPAGISMSVTGCPRRIPHSVVGLIAPPPALLRDPLPGSVRNSSAPPAPDSSRVTTRQWVSSICG